MTDGITALHIDLFNYLDRLKSSASYNAHEAKLHAYLHALVKEDNKRTIIRNRYPQRKNLPYFPIYKGGMIPEELVYFGSPLNKEMFLRTFSEKDPPDYGFANIPEVLQRQGRTMTSKEQSCCNLDLVTLKKEKRRIQIIESKHTSERPPSEGQDKILRRLAHAFNYLNLHSQGAMESWRYEIYLIIGDEPYAEGAKIVNLLSPLRLRDERYATEKELFDLLSFRINFEDIRSKSPTLFFSQKEKEESSESE